MTEPHPKTLLLVEDEPITALAEKAILERNGYSVLTAATGEQAVDRADDARIDLILMDIELGPGIDGTEAAEKILRSHMVPIVFLSSHTEPEVVEKTEGITSYGYIVKNSGETVLLASIKMAFRLFGAHEQLESHKEQLNIALVEKQQSEAAVIEKNAARDITERRKAEDALRERIKELECLYRISEIVEERGITPDGILQKTAEAIPASWQYPTSTVCRITVNGYEYVSEGFTTTQWVQGAGLYVDGQRVGAVEVYYTDEHAPADEGPFLHEERRLMEAVAERLGRVIERARRQKALNRERVLLSTVLDTLDTAVVICDEHARIIRFNETARRLHGIPETPVPSDRWADYYDLYMEDGKTPLPTEQVPLFRAFKGEHVQNAEIIVSPKGGTPRRLSCNGARLIDTSGNMHGAVIAMHDITDRHETETRLVESEAKYRSLIEDVLDSSDVAIFILDSRFRIVWVNAAAEKYFGIQRDQALGTKKELLISGHIKGIMEAPDLFERHMVSSYKTNDHVQRFECHVLENPEAGLQERWLEHWSKPIEHGLYAGGRVEHYTDISRRKSANERVHELVEEKEHLLKEVQHRIKNTMNTMVSMLSMQADSLRHRNPDAATALNDARSRFQSMEVLYDQLYRTETHESGSLPEYLNQLLRTIPSFFPFGETVEISTNLDTITLDTKRLTTVGIIVNELVTNAMKYAFASRGTGKLFVSALRNGEHITITVADNGPGLPDTFKNVRESSFGMTMIEALSEQLEGTIKFEHDGGLRTTLEFPQ